MSDETQSPNSSTSDTNATTIHGNVTSGRDFVGRDVNIHGDQVQRDKVGGDKYVDSPITVGDIENSTGIAIGHGATANVTIQRLDPSDARNQRNHAVMRQLVRSFWIDGVLRHSLYNEVLIRLNMEERPDAVDNRPWDLLLQQPGQPDYSIPAGTPIVDVFDQMARLLLILGEPGSGKTTTLLELADALLKRAEKDPTHPTPIIVNLSSWAEKRQSLAEWLVNELRTKYNIPKKVAQKWVEDDELLPLLDGLDEVRQEYRNACVEAINQYYRDHIVPMAICSRVTEYEDLATQLKLLGAVLVQPLTLTQISEYLDTVDADLSAVFTTLQQDTELQKMATSPLILSIMTMAYHGASETELAAIETPSNRHQHLFNAYIRRMFSHRKRPHLYPVGRTLSWLNKLAKSMNQHEVSIFSVETLQPKYSLKRFYLLVYILVDRIGWTLLFGMTFGAVARFIYPSSDWLHYGLVHGVVAGLLGGTLQPEKKYVHRLLGNLSIGLVVAFLMIFLTMILHGFLFGPEMFLTSIDPSSDVAFFAYLFLIGITGKPTHLIRQIIIVEQLRWSIIKALWVALGITTVFGGFSVLVVGLLWYSVGVEDGFALSTYVTRNAIESSILEDLPKGILTVMSFLVSFAVIGGFESKKIVATATSGRGLWKSFYNATLMGFLVGSSIGMLCGYASAKSPDLVLASMVLGSLSFGLCGWLVLGGYATLSHLILRLVLWTSKSAPLNYARFLDYCHERIFLRKVGGGYIFIHRMLMEHFASLTDEDIERIAGSVESRR